MSSCPICAEINTKVLRPKIYGSVNLLKCGACKSEFLDPQPDDNRLAQIYGPDYYKAWTYEDESNVLKMKQRTFDLALKEVDLSAVENVLELGSATGDFAELLVARGPSIYGIDLNETACEVARRRVPSGNFHVGTLADQPWHDVEFQLVAMFDFIEHVRSPKSELSQVGQRLRSGAFLLISTPNSTSVSRTLFRRFWPQYREEHLTLISRAGMMSLLRQSGFEVVKLKKTKKFSTANYLFGQLISFPIPIVTPIIRVLWRFIPIPKSRPIGLYFGEMTVLAKKL